MLVFRVAGYGVLVALRDELGDEVITGALAEGFDFLRDEGVAGVEAWRELGEEVGPGGVVGLEIGVAERDGEFGVGIRVQGSGVPFEGLDDEDVDGEFVV